MKYLSILFLISVVGHCSAQHALPAVLPQATIAGTASNTCPSADQIEQAKNISRIGIRSALRDTVVPILDFPSQCPCGGRGSWRRIAYLNMSDPSQLCPSTWRLITTPVRGCGRVVTGTGSCDSTIFPSGGRSYSRVCGRVNGYQKGSPDGFFPSVGGGQDDLEDAYVDGVSLTHGSAGSRQHIWTFTAALYETAGNPATVCSCINTNINWPYQVPSFIGDNYFCATGNPGPGFINSNVYADDLLWDGEGCGPTNACCEFNTPPWFCTTLPQPTTDDLEVRNCHNQAITDEDVIISLIDIRVM